VQKHSDVTTAESLTVRLDALAAALREAGVDPERAASLLGSAATATMNALVLDAVLEENATPPQAAPAAQPEQAPLRVAA
jgi:hypothetical protein